MKQFFVSVYTHFNVQNHEINADVYSVENDMIKFYTRKTNENWKPNKFTQTSPYIDKLVAMFPAGMSAITSIIIKNETDQNES